MAHRDVKSHNVLIDAREAGQATADGRFHAKVRLSFVSDQVFLHVCPELWLESSMCDSQVHDLTVERSRLCACQVADLGSAVVLQEGTQVTDEAGTSGWIAPEVRANALS